MDTGLPILLMIVSTSILLGSGVVSMMELAPIRYIFFFVVAGVSLYVSISSTGIITDYFLNISTELFGAMIAAVLLSPVILNDRWLFLFSILLLSASAFLIQWTPPQMYPFFINISTELIGGFVIIVLIQQRRFFWTKLSVIDRKMDYRKQRQQLDNEYARKALRDEPQSFEDVAQQQFEYEKDTRANNITQEIEKWRHQMEGQDVTIIVTGQTDQEVRQKCRDLSRNLDNIVVLRMGFDVIKQETTCYFTAQIKH